MGVVAPVLSDVPPQLAQILTRLVAPVLAERPATAAELVDTLDRVARAMGLRVPPVRPRASTLVGRASEIDQLRSAWSRAGRGSQVIFVQGASGTGKTSLVNAFLADVAAARATVFAAACHRRDPRAFSAVRQLVDAHLRKIDSLPISERLEVLADVRRLGGEHAALLKLLSPAVARVFKDAPTIPASA